MGLLGSKQVKSVIALLAALGLLAIAPGCWNRRELDTLSLVVAIGIDRSKETGEIILSSQIIKPGEIRTGGGMEEKGSGANAVWVLTSRGKTVFEAFRNGTMESDRKLFLPHIKVIVIGEEAARAGVKPLLDFLDRDHEPRRLSWVFVAKGRAQDIIEAVHEQEKVPATALESLTKASGATSMAVKINLHEFLKRLASKSTAPFASRVEAVPMQEGGQEEKGKMEGKGKMTFKMSGAAAFKKDRLAGWLEGTQTRGLLWILGQVKSGIIVVKSPQEETKDVSIEIIRTSSQVKPEIKDGKLRMIVEIEEEGNLGEEMSQADLIKPENFALLEKRQREAIEKEVQAVLKQAQQEWGTDLFGFGEAVHRKYPAYWKSLQERWEEEFPRLPVEVKVTAKLRRFGLASQPAKTQ